jgi:hypothetical protein
MDKMESAIMFNQDVVNELEENLKKIIKHKHSDLFLLCFLIAVFGTLLIISASG